MAFGMNKPFLWISVSTNKSNIRTAQEPVIIKGRLQKPSNSIVNYETTNMRGNTYSHINTDSINNYKINDFIVDELTGITYTIIEVGPQYNIMQNSILYYKLGLAVNGKK